MCFSEIKNHVEKFDIQSIEEYTNHYLFLVKVGELVSTKPQDQVLFIHEVVIKRTHSFN